MASTRLVEQLRWLVAAALAVALLGFGGGWLWSQLSGTAAARRVLGDRVEEVPGLGRGATDAEPRCGVAHEPVDEAVYIATLQTGAVVLRYRPEALDADEHAGLGALPAQYASHLLIAPHPDLGSAVEVTALDHRLRLEDLDPSLVRAFAAGYGDPRGPPETCLVS